jgi:stage V sporulation protein B
MALSGPILDLLFSDVTGIAIATPLLGYLGAAFFFMCCAAIFAPLLQAVGRASIPVINTAIAIAVKIVCNYILVAIPEIGINGAAISNIVLYVVLFALNLIALRRITKVRTDVKSVYIKPLIGGALCGLTAWGVYALIGSRLGNSISTILSIGVAAVVYFVFILFSKTIKKEDVEFLPKAKKIEKILEKRNWIG